MMQSNSTISCPNYHRSPRRISVLPTRTDRVLTRCPYAKCFDHLYNRNQVNGFRPVCSRQSFFHDTSLTSSVPTSRARVGVQCFTPELKWILACTEGFQVYATWCSSWDDSLNDPFWSEVTGLVARCIVVMTSQVRH